MAEISRRDFSLRNIEVSQFFKKQQYLNHKFLTNHIFPAKMKTEKVKIEHLYKKCFTTLYKIWKVCVGKSRRDEVLSFHNTMYKRVWRIKNSAA